MKTCCKVLELVLSRGTTGGMGMHQLLNMRTGEATDTLVINFRRAKRGEDGEYGFWTKFGRSTWAPVVFCPFCGTKQQVSP